MLPVSGPVAYCATYRQSETLQEHAKLALQPEIA